MHANVSVSVTVSVSVSQAIHKSIKVKFVACPTETHSPQGRRGHREVGAESKVDRRSVSGEFCRVPPVSKARPGRQVIGSGIHIQAWPVAI